MVLALVELHATQILGYKELSQTRDLYPPSPQNQKQVVRAKPSRQGKIATNCCMVNYLHVQ